MRCQWTSQSSTFVVLLICVVNYATCQIFNDPSITARWLKSVTDDLETELVKNVVRRSTSADELVNIYSSMSPKTTTLVSNDILKDAISKADKIFKTAEELVEALVEEAENIEERSLISKKTLANEQVTFYQKAQNETDPLFKQVPLPPTSVTGHDVIEKENATLYYYNAKCNCEDSHQLFQLTDRDSVDCFTPPTKFAPNEFFSDKEISLSASAVHIPVDMYNEGSDVLKDIAWTKDLEPFLNRSLCNASLNGGNTKWLYVATLNGVLRYFPSSPWNVPCGEIDFYDARSTPWFVQSMSSPKDVLIMVDTSGSTAGLTLDLIHLSVNHVMSSLSNNDFFNIFVFNDSATFLNKNCPGLLQATPLNKQLALSWMSTNVARKKSSFEKGFEFAFDVLSEENSTFFRSSAKAMRASCNPLILLFTDGGAEYPGAVFNKWNFNKHTRIFTYSVGKHFSSTASLKDMACNNRGVFLPIPSDSATHIQTMEYLAKLSKPMAFSKMKANTWTLPYEDHLGLGTVMTVSRPIYNNFIRSPTHRYVLGVGAVAGTDILYRDIEKAFDTSKWGASTYMFGVENNGHLFYHPRLKKGRLNTPVTVDLSDMETMDVNEIRRNMIDKTPGSDVSLQRETLSQDGRHLTTSSYKYSYAEIPKHDFSVALALPANGMHRLDSTLTLRNNRRPIQVEDILLPDDDIYSAAYGFQCEQSTTKQAQECDINNLFNSSKLKSSVPSHLLEDVVMSSSCGSDGGNKEQLDELRLHGYVTRELARDWSTPLVPGIVGTVFVATDSKPSVLRIKHFGNEDYQQQITSALSDPASKDYFLRALLSSPTTIFTLLQFDPEYTSSMTTSNPSSTSDTDTADGVTSRAYEQSTFGSSIHKIKYLLVSEAVTVRSEGEDTLPAVTGAALSYDDVKEKIWNMTIPKCSNSQECLNAYNCWSTDLMCAVLDDGGMLLLSNKDRHLDKVGTFFGEIDGKLMTSMENDDLYTSRDVYDYQAVCKVLPESDSSGPGNFRLPTLATLLNAGWWFTSTLWLIVQNLVTGVISLASDEWGIPFQTFEYTSPNTNSMKRHCVLKTTVFSFGSRTSVSESEDECNRTYAAMRVPNTNLLLVISQLDEESCSSPYSSISPIHEDVTQKIQRPSERYRAPPHGGECYDAKARTNFPYELDTECGSAYSRVPNHLLILCSASFLLFTMTFNL